MIKEINCFEALHNIVNTQKKKHGRPKTISWPSQHPCNHRFATLFPWKFSV